MTTLPAQRLRPDAIERQLKGLAKQGGHMAMLAHLCAFLLIILFSLGSLVSLSGDALASILRAWHASGALDVPAAISVAVSTLLVLAMDVAMVYAASVLRMLTARHAHAAEKRQHQLVMGMVAILEASTYAYMSALYDHPTSLAAWALILARAGAAPFLAVYLSMARPLPVERRDILAAAALASGAGVLRDVTEIANDASAPLARKVALYKAADWQHGRDDQQLDRMIAALAPDAPVAGVRTALDDATNASADHYTSLQDGSRTATDMSLVNAPLALAEAPAPLQVQGETIDREGVRTHDDTTPPTGPGTPVKAPASRRQRRQSQPAILRLEPDRPRQARHAARAGGVSAAKVRTPGNESLEAVARQAFATGATSIPKMRRATGMGQSAAQSWVRALKAEAAGAPISPATPTPQPLPGLAFRGVLVDDASDAVGATSDPAEDYAL